VLRPLCFHGLLLMLMMIPWVLLIHGPPTTTKEPQCLGAQGVQSANLSVPLRCP